MATGLGRRFDQKHPAPLSTPSSTSVTSRSSMQWDSFDPALEAANVALTGRRVEHTTSRLASVQLRHLETPNDDRLHVAWEAGAMLAVGLAALAAVLGVWFL